MSALLELRDLAVLTDGPRPRLLVEPVCFTLQAGQAMTLLGESGSGKSLLAQAIMGTLPPGLQARGAVRLQGDESAAAQAGRRRAAWGRRLALLPQEPWSALDPTMRAQQQVSETYRLVLGLPAATAATRTAQDLDRLGLAHAQRHFPHMLSGGMAQRLAFAATTAGGAPLLIVDEPTKGLDLRWRDQIVGLLQSVLAGGGAVLVISHDIGVPRALGGQVAVMRDARIVEIGPAASVLAAPAQPYTRALLAADPACWPARPARAPAADTEASLLLQASHLSQRVGEHALFEPISLRLHAGERVAILGDSGAGKTTLGDVLLGLRRPTSGSVQRAAGLRPQAFQKLYQDPLAAFAPRLPLHTAMQDLLRRHGLPQSALSALLQRLGLDEALLQRRPDQVSGGELQRLALARVLLLEPALVFADEPTSRLDPISQQQTMELLTATLQERGGALLLVTHEPALARQVADRCISLVAPTAA